MNGGMKLLGLQPEWAIFRVYVEPGGISFRVNVFVWKN